MLYKKVLLLLTVGLFSSPLLADGESDYKTVCFACHDTGVAGAPKVGDVAAWKSRIDQGVETLYANVLNPAGFTGTAGYMPPRGGSGLDDDAIKAVVDYMVENSQ